MDDELVKNLRDALNNLYNPEQLRSNMLAVVFGVGGRYDTPVAMQKALENLIQDLKPKPGEALRSQKRRAFDLLYSRYVDQFSQKEVADQLGVSLRTYQREQQVALELLAAQLAEKYPLKQKRLSQNPILSEDDQESENIPAQGEFARDEFAWMFGPTAEKSADLQQVLESMQVLVQPLISRYSVDFRTEIEHNLPGIATHPEALLQILINLFSVFLHRAARGSMRLSADVYGGSVVIELSTSHCPPELFQISESDQASLDIVERLIHFSEGTFTCEIKQKKVHATIHLPGIESLPVLVVDDSVDNIMLLQRYLSGTRYRVVSLNQPEQALEMIVTSQPQAVVLDLMMPRIDGLEILTRLRTHPTACQVPVIVCTILPQEELVLSLGASAFLRKPIKREDLLQVLDRLVLVKGPDAD